MKSKKAFIFLLIIALLSVSCAKRAGTAGAPGETAGEFYRTSEIYPWLYSIEDVDNSVYCYLLIGNESALLFDTTYGNGNLYRVIEELTDLPVTVVLGHGHFDHTGGAYQIFSYLNSDVYLHEADFGIYRSSNQEMRFLKKLNIGQVFDLGGLNVEVIAMEGHTAGSIGILVKEQRVLLTSDSSNPHIWLFLNESLPINQYITMLERVIKLDFDTFFIGHSDEAMNKDDFKSFIKAARNISEEKSERHPDYNSVFVYEEDGARVYFRGDPNKWAQEIESELPPGNLGAFDLVLRDNFFYGNGYQGLIRERNLLNGYKLKKGDVYKLKVTYTASRDLENNLLVGFVDTLGGKWITLSYKQKNIEMPNDILGLTSKAGEEVSSEVTISLLKGARTSNSSANTLVIETPGDGRHRSRNSGVQGPVTLSFSEFVLTKVK